jgi:hypothetical protein
VLSLLCARDASAHGPARDSHDGIETALVAADRTPRAATWAELLAPVEVCSVGGGPSASIRLYTPEGEVDEAARMRFEHVAARDGEQHVLEARLEQLVMKASYHFHGARITIVSGWREHAGRHTSGEALDFKLEKVPAATLASYLRGLPRVGVGIYTHPRTQYVHLDVREPSFHWIDASPPGVKWKERQLRDPGREKRDASWTPECDLPI